MRHALAFVPICLFIAKTDSAQACTCIHTPLEEQIRDATIVFRGRQIAATQLDARDLWVSHVLIFEVYEAWRGVDTRTIAIGTGSGGGDCGFGDTLGSDELLVLTRTPKKPGRLPGVSICGDPVPVGSAVGEIAALGPGVRPDRPSARGWVGGAASFALAALP